MVRWQVTPKVNYVCRKQLITDTGQSHVTVTRKPQTAEKEYLITVINGAIIMSRGNVEDRARLRSGEYHNYYEMMGQLTGMVLCSNTSVCVMKVSSTLPARVAGSL